MILAALIAPPALTFAFFGCNRVDKSDIDLNVNPSSANLAQLTRTLEEVRAAHASMLFAGGDLVNGYADDDGSVLEAQLAAWANDVSGFRSSFTLIPVPGNHELNKKVGDQRMPSTLTYPIWKSWLVANGFPYGRRGPTPLNDKTDSLAMDESKMSYTLDRAGVRFIVLNTDTRTFVKDETTGTALGWIPADWAAKELSRAESDSSVRAVFVLGHRNLIDPSVGKGDAPIAPAAAKRLVAAMRGKKKLRAYICAHVHAWNLGLIPGTGALQIISGDGGSKLEKWAKPEFGWLEVRVKSDGSAIFLHHHRPVPEPYNSTAAAAPSNVDAAQPLR